MLASSGTINADENNWHRNMQKVHPITMQYTTLSTNHVRASRPLMGFETARLLTFIEPQGASHGEQQPTPSTISRGGDWIQLNRANDYNVVDDVHCGPTAIEGRDGAVAVPRGPHPRSARLVDKLSPGPYNQRSRFNLTQACIPDNMTGRITRVVLQWGGYRERFNGKRQHKFGMETVRCVSPPPEGRSPSAGRRRLRRRAQARARPATPPTPLE